MRDNKEQNLFSLPLNKDEEKIYAYSVFTDYSILISDLKKKIIRHLVTAKLPHIPYVLSDMSIYIPMITHHQEST